MSLGQSPGIYPIEIDRSDAGVTVAGVPAAIVGKASRGAVGEVKLVTSAQAFLDEFGTPQPGNYFHLSALQFLTAGNQLYCARVVGAGATYSGAYAVSSGSAFALDGSSAAAARDFIAGGDRLFAIFAKDPGVWGNSVSVEILPNDPTVAASTGDVIASSAPEPYSFKIVVYVGGILAETWVVSRKRKLDGFGSQMYLEDRINGNSKYIYVADGTAADTVMPTAYVSGSQTALSLGGGEDGAEPGAGEFISAWGNLFGTVSGIRLRVLIGAGAAHLQGTELSSVQVAMAELASSRADCVAILDVPSDKATSAASGVVEYRNTSLNLNTSHAALYSAWVRAFDRFNGSVTNVPPSGYVAAVLARLANSGGSHQAPAGPVNASLNVRGLTKLYTEGELDLLYVNGVNPLFSSPGEGTMIYGHKTLQRRASATDRLNVRMMLLDLRESLVSTLRGYLFQLNTADTRSRVTASCDAACYNFSARGAFNAMGGDLGYAVVCDDSNNTADVVARNELRVDVKVRPAQSADFIRLGIIVTGAGVSFSEINA